MKLRLFATVGVIALSVWLLVGCAGTPSSSESNWEVGNRPQLLMPGAIRSDVKGLAMGAARSKGWTIVSSSEDRLVVQRPLDPTSPTALALGPSGGTLPPTVEVTSAFVERSDGVLVALGADLISQPAGEKAPKRVDYTETFRAELTQSLESLRSNWTANRERVANAMPSQSTQSEPPPTDAGAAAANPLVKAWAETVEEGSVGQPASTSPPATATADSPATPPSPAFTQTPTPRALPAPSTPVPVATPTPVAPPAPTRTATGPAPVVDGSSAVSGSTRATQTQSALPAVLPPVRSDPISPEDNMLALNPSSGSGTWAYYAEQYARLRGCNVADQGAQLIESRTDGEILKVACTGADSFLLKCQNGVCRALQ